MQYNVKFLTGTSEQFKDITPVDTTLYFLTDTQELYKGKTLFASGKAASDITKLAARVAMNETNIGTTQQMSVNIKTILETLNGDVTKDGSVKKQIADAIAALDSSFSKEAGADGLALSITLADGKVTNLSGSIAANTYDAYGAAKAVQGETSSTVKTVEDNLAAEVTRATGVEGDKATLTTDDKTSLVAAINEVDAHANAAQSAADNAQDAADAAQGDVDALKALVGTLPEGATSTTVVDYVAEKANAVSGNVTALAGRVDTAEGNITTLQGQVATINGNADTEGSIAHAVKAEETRALAAEKKNADAIAAEVKRAGDAETALDARLDVIEGEGEGSIKKAASDAVAKVVAEAPEAFDTLKEIADWIGSGEAIQGTTAASMLADINTLKGGETVEGSVAKALKDAKDYADTEDAKIESRVDALETAVGEGGSVASQITAKINELDATVSNMEGALSGDGIKVTVTQTDGKITAVDAQVEVTTEVNAAKEAAISAAKDYTDAALTWGTIA